jgi:hypothetical protein
LINSTNQISQNYISGLSTTLSNYQTKISLTNPSDSSFVAFGSGTLGEWFDNYYNKTETDTLLNSKQPLMNINNKLDSSLITGLTNASTTMLSTMVYMNPFQNLNSY